MRAASKHDWSQLPDKDGHSIAIGVKAQESERCQNSHSSNKSDGSARECGVSEVSTTSSRPPSVRMSFSTNARQLRFESAALPIGGDRDPPEVQVRSVISSAHDKRSPAPAWPLPTRSIGGRSVRGWSRGNRSRLPCHRVSTSICLKNAGTGGVECGRIVSGVGFGRVAAIMQAM